MHKPIRTFLSVIVLATLLASCSERPSEKYTTGLKVYKEFDKSRFFDSASKDQPYRPVKIDLFYPSSAQPSTKPMTYGAFLDMYEQRMNYKISLDSCKMMSMNLASSFADYLHIDSAQKILNVETGIYEGLELPSGKHPVIIYAAGMNGSSWENEILFDSLAKAGYIVAAISSVGIYPGYMTAAADLNEQVQDILFARKFIASLPFIDTSNIGLLSWSMGGSAITKAAMLDPDFKCLISMDGTEMHYFGSDTAWDSEYREIMHIEPFSPEKINAPYLYLSSEHPKERDSIYQFLNFVSSREKYFFQFNGGTHEDFSTIITTCKRADPKIGNIDSSRNETICKLVVTFFDEYLKKSKAGMTEEYIKQLVADKPTAYATAIPVK